MKVTVYDNGGSKHSTADRYTVEVMRDEVTYEVYGMSENALDVQGFNYFSHEDVHAYRPAKGEKVVELRELPHDVLVAIIERMQTV